MKATEFQKSVVRELREQFGKETFYKHDRANGEIIRLQYSLWSNPDWVTIREANWEVGYINEAKVFASKHGIRAYGMSGKYGGVSFVIPPIPKVSLSQKVLLWNNGLCQEMIKEITHKAQVDKKGLARRMFRSLNPFSWDEVHAKLKQAEKEAEEALDQLPILADMLEEAGCTDYLLLELCRNKNPWFMYRLFGYKEPKKKIFTKTT